MLCHRGASGLDVLSKLLHHVWEHESKHPGCPEDLKLLLGRHY